jgi:hypothetical protein
MLKLFGPQQDGALHHHNPAKIALWEQRFIWGCESQQERPDCLLSIGTGTKVENFKENLISPAKERSHTRVIAALNWNLDAEQAWKDVENFASDELRPRLHRINLPLDKDEPNIDDIAMIDFLASETESFAANNSKVQSCMDSLLASAFYFRLTRVCEQAEGYSCAGYILCRLHLSRTSRLALYQKMLDKSAYFLVEGRPIRCLTSMPQNASRFKRQVKFTVSDLDDRLFISLNGITTKPWYISGLPCSVRDLVEAQGLFASFGRLDHWCEQEESVVSRKRCIDVVR